MRLALLAPLLVAAAACNLGTNVGSSADAGPIDTGPVVIACTLSFPEPDSECPPETPECSFGVCKRPCAASDGCNDPATFCNSNSGYCEFGCRDSSTCGGGTVCSAGACIASAGCATKCDCAAGQICSDGSCVEPPATCDGIDQCGRGADGDPCEDLLCNSFTNLCFDDDPTPCTNDADCSGRPGCGGGCTCTGNQACVPSVACTEQNELTTCGAGNYCDGNGSCQVAPSCTTEAQCTSLGLTCNLAGGVCERTAPCNTNADCTIVPATFCNPVTDFCAQPLCTNDGVTCAVGEQCSPDGRCFVQGTGGPCTVDANCDPSEYCAPLGAGQCTVGCRNNSSCANANLTCNGAHQCVGGSAGDLAGFGENCTADGDCQTGLICGSFTTTCAEPCAAASTNCASDGCCPLSGSPCCNVVFILPFCGGC